MTRARLALFVAVVMVAVISGSGYLVYASMRSHDATVPVSSERTAEQVLQQPHIVYLRSTDDASYGSVLVAPLTHPDEPTQVPDTSCVRVYASAADGVCIVQGGVLAPSATVQFLDPSLRPDGRDSLPLNGVPSRARLSRDGSKAAATAFVTGHSYADASFSTATEIYDVGSGRSLGNLETFTVLKDGQRYESPDVNIWGVTFRPGTDQFYATLRTKGRPYLMQGDISERTLTVIADDVECPSLSPDGTRVAFKRSDGSSWGLFVLDVARGTTTALSETYSVDDQVEWLDDETILYARQPDGANDLAIWQVPADGSGAPAILVPQAFSPAVVR